MTLYRQPNANQGAEANAAGSSAGMAAMQAIKRHSVDFVHLKDVAVSEIYFWFVEWHEIWRVWQFKNILKENLIYFQLQDEVEGTVTKSIRLTAALILRNLASYSNSAKRWELLPDAGRDPKNHKVKMIFYFFWPASDFYI